MHDRLHPGQSTEGASSRTMYDDAIAEYDRAVENLTLIGDALRRGSS